MMDIDLLKQAAWKLDSFMGDINELLHGDEGTPDEKEILVSILDTTSSMLVRLMNDITSQVGEEDDFINDVSSYDDEIEFDSWNDINSEDMDPMETILTDDDIVFDPGFDDF